MGQATAGVGNNAAPAAQNLGGNAPAQTDASQQASEAAMQKTFDTAVANNARITDIQTKGNTEKRAASAAPN